MGIRRMQAESGRSQTRKRLPMTPAILRRIRRLWNERATRGEYIMSWAALTLCFFGFFRSGELTVPTGKSFDASIHLSWGDVAINDPRNPRAIKVRLRRSKTDQFGNGVDVIVGRTGDDLCPVAAVAAFMARRGNAAGPFFRFPDGSPLTKAKFIGFLRGAVGELGLPADQFAGHSLRIGAATTAAQVGFEDSTIMTLGRWNSAAYLRYIRTPETTLAAATARLSSSATE